MSDGNNVTVRNTLTDFPLIICNFLAFPSLYDFSLQLN